ncbi:MAG TPA: Crp/Fnr family transcriptional regulator [Gemmatimonadaceae bacterium]|nr:Crp/Fnr family transcriptional regulator [Gemmatimonadaceae bacterium]
MSTAVASPLNRILAALPDDQYARIAPSLDLVELELKQVLFDVDRPIEHVYFVEDGVASVLGVMADGTAVETATIGREGMVGLALFHGAEQTSAQAFCQVPGRAYRMSAAAFRAEAERQGALTRMLHRYSHALLTLIAQSSACNRLHSMSQRCARWLLLTHDRVGADEFALTHQFLSQMLGVRRATVTEAAGALQARRAITYTYGRIRVLDRGALEAAACECYRIIRREFDRLLDGGRSSAPSPLDGVKTSEDGRTTIGDGTPRAPMPDA